MGKNNSVNLDITNNSDGFDISGGTTSRKLSVTGGDITLSGSGSATITFPTTSTTVAGLGIAQAFTATQSFAAGISVTGATFNSRANFAAGLTTANLFVTSGATFNSLANFAAGLTTANLFVTSGATFNSRANFAAGLTTANLVVSDGATFGGNINSATLKDYGEVFAYQVRKEIGDSKTNNKYLVNLTYGNTFYLDLNTDNSGVLGGYATQQGTPVIRLPAYGYATVSTTAGLTGATAQFVIGSSTAAVTGCFIFGPGLTSAGVTAVSYNATTQTLVLSKSAQQTVSAQPHAFVRNTTEGYGMTASPHGGSLSVLSPARVHSFTLVVNSATAGAITWQTGATHYGQIKWPSGTAPTLSTTANKLDVFSFLSTDWGTTWLAFNAGQNF